MPSFDINSELDLRPFLHFTASENWLNDPNGFSYYNGFYHLFYQHNPKGLTWGNISWGHAISKDLKVWSHLPVALTPDQIYDKDGVFSGSGIELEGKHVLYYTGVVHEEKGLMQVQCMAESIDGIVYSKNELNPILVGGTHEDPYDFRDPKVWVEEDLVYMIVATRGAREGKANVYQSKDGKVFSFLTDFRKDGTGYMWECPDLFKINDQRLLMFSAMGVGKGNSESLSYIAPVIMVPHEYETQVGDFQLMDYGYDFYAPQSMVDLKNRQVVMGWLRMLEPLDENQNWTGMMTLPREVLMHNGHITYQIIEEVFENKSIYWDKPLSKYAVNWVDLEDSYCYEIKTTFLADCDFKLSLGEASNVTITYDSSTRKVILKRKLMGEDHIYETPVLNQSEVTLQIILDRCVAEVFVNEGAYVISAIFQNKAKKIAIESSAEITKFEIYKL